jgi:hypothetical protein
MQISFFTVTELIYSGFLRIYSDGLRAGGPGFDSWLGHEIFLFSTSSRPALLSTQPPIQWVLEALYPGVKRSGSEADHSPQSTTEVKKGGAISPLTQTSSLHWEGKLYLSLCRSYSLVSFTPRPLYPLGKSPLYPLDRRLGGPQNRSERRGEEQLFTLPGLELRPLGCPARNQLLYRLSFPGSYQCRQCQGNF